MKPTRQSAQPKPKLSPAVSSAALRRASTRSFPVVGIGASAGGLEAITQLLRSLPKKSGLAFVFVQHLAPRYQSALPSLLSHITPIPVTEVKDNMRVERDHLYVIPPNVTMGMLNGRLHLMPRSPSLRHLPIDFFFRSLAEERGNKAIGVILSGTASDGTMGMKAIKAEGGITFAQDEKSAKYTDMPRNAVAAGCVDAVLPPEGIAAELARIASHPYLRQPAGPEPPEASGERDEDLRKIFVLLRTATGVDFTNYKHSTIRRRIKRRMMLHKCHTQNEYISRLQDNPPEVDALFQDILIHVTGFFRDTSAFKTLKQDIFPVLLKDRPAGNPIRIWVPGCSTGEEVYSLAICLFEAIGDAKVSPEIQIFGTDISEAGLQKARLGIYPEGITADVDADRLRRFFVKTSRGYQVSKLVREFCVFARQDVVKDPPFSRVDLISCRNLLIYFGPVLQKKVVPIFHYALQPGGYLFLGSSETVDGYASLFSLVDKKHKIYAKKRNGTASRLDFSRSTFRWDRPESAPSPRETPSAFDLQKDVDRILLTRYVPAGVLVNKDLEILQFRGRTGNFLEPPLGQPSLTLAKMAREGLFPDLRETIQRAKKDDAPVKKEGIPIWRDGRLVEVGIEVIPIKGALPAETYFLVMFEDAPFPKGQPTEWAGRQVRRLAANQRVQSKREAQLREELVESKASLESIIEEQETGNEELRSANEEILSSNEELQSTNEELETAKEELQSTNEELNTVNEELANRNQELGTANNDLLNLIASSSVPTLILGNDLCIRHFTPPAEKLLNLIPADVGRPISDLKPNLIFSNFAQAIVEAIDNLSLKEYEVRDTAGLWYTMRIRPYKTADNKLDGAVITWNDISTLKASLEGTEKALSESAERYRMLFERNLAGVFRVTGDGRFLECNSALARMLGYESIAQVRGASAAELFGSPENMNDFVARLKQNTQSLSVELSMRKKDGKPAWVMMNAFLLPKKENAAAAEIEGIALDISDRKQAEEALGHLSGWLLESQESERKRISRELHDTTGSNLAALIANLGLAVKSDHAQEKKLCGILQESLNLAKQCAQEIRTMSYLLHPPLLEETGLVSALRWYVEGFVKRSGVDTKLDMSPELPRLPKEMEIALFRIVQECLTNIHRHAGSSNAHISLRAAQDKITLEVSDDGKGIPLAVAAGADKLMEHIRPGVGILSMRERAHQLGGTLEIKSGKNGTSVLAVFPYLPATDEVKLLAPA